MHHAEQLSRSSRAPFRWNEAEDNPDVQLYSNYAIAGAYALVALVAAVSLEM